MNGPLWFLAGLLAGVGSVWIQAKLNSLERRGLVPRDSVAEVLAIKDRLFSPEDRADTINDLRIGVAEAVRALELATPDRAAVEAGAVPTTLLFAQRLTIKMLMRVIEGLTCAATEVRHGNDPA